MGSYFLIGTEFMLGMMTNFWVYWGWSHNIVNVFKATEFYTYEWLK